MLIIEVGQIVHLNENTPPKGVEFVALSHDNNLAVSSVLPARVATVEDENQDQPAAAAEGEAEEK